MRHFNKFFFVLLIAAMLYEPMSLRAQAFTEGFNDITTLTGSGWFMQNNSVPLGSTNWFQGNSDVFSAQSGAATAYIGTNFNNTTGANTISNWLVTPSVTISNGDVLSFYTRTTDDNTYPDRLQVRMSTNGASTNVGTGSAAVGDFTTLLLDINPTLVTSVYPYLSWGFYSITITGLSAPVSGRFAFRYFVTNGGPSGTNSDYIGIDEVIYTPFVCPAVTLSPLGSVPDGTTGTVYSALITQTGALGPASFEVTDGNLPPGISLSTSGVLSGLPTLAGTYNFTVTVASDYNCSKSEDYIFQVNCPANPIVFPEFEPICSNIGNILLNTATPSGGTYSGTGVENNFLDPTSGSQTITYTYTDMYGCEYSDENDIVVNIAPEVTHSAIDPICIDNGMVSLMGGSPENGFYEGNGIEENNFNPEAGSQMLHYIFIDDNQCSDTAYIQVTVYELTTLVVMDDMEICQYEPITLSASTNGTAAWYISGSEDELTELTVTPMETTEYVVVAQNGVCAAVSDTVMVTVKNVVETPAIINGNNVVCQGQGDVYYSVDPQTDALSYIWTLPNGAYGASTTNEIYISYGIWAVSGNITVAAVNDCGTSDAVILEITVNQKPPTPIIIQSGATLISNSGTGNQWYNDDGAIDGANSQFFDYEGDGNYYVIVTVNGCASDPSNVISIINSSVFNGLSGSIIGVYPNPARDQITVSAAGNLQFVVAEIVNSLGQVIEQAHFSGSFIFDLTGYPEGLYFINATINGKNIATRFIKE
ncbi:MAG: T9SS type A sorting domain-containing protein [Bacteroidales bacterium]|nr:T9SS type A sorting domain-containing protein [Bacteroidales bacterium]HOY39275.1 choice-of-anchor J domain-containing protein [Bacteroidales bacterium]HQP04055.1 choice-of-anchor J domain-containing protein [Bacteroidales bacterium]